MEAMENVRIVLSKNLKSRRKELEINQDELAERSGLSTTYVKNIERGVSWPSPESFEALAKGLGVSAGELLRDSFSIPEKVVGVSKIIKKLAAIPDNVYDLAQGIPTSDKAWEDVEASLEMAHERIKAGKSKESNS